MPDPKDKKRKRRSLLVDPRELAAPRDASRADLRALLGPPPKEEPRMPERVGASPSHVGQRPDFGPELGPEIPIRQGSALQGMERGPGQGMVREAIARGHTALKGGTEEDARALMAVLDYLFEPPKNKEERKAYRKWALSNASWSELPKGALGAELLVGSAGDIAAAGIPGSLQALRDIWKDVSNGEAGMHNLLDAVGALPIIGLVGMAASSADDIAKAARKLYRTAHLAEDVRLSRVVRRDPNSRTGLYHFKTPAGDVEVHAVGPGEHSWPGKVPRTGENIPPEKMVHVSIRMRGGSYNRGSEGILEGDANLHEIFRILGTIFPDAEYVGGTRVTGSRRGPQRAVGATDDIAVAIRRAPYPEESRAASPAQRRLLKMREEDPAAYERLVEDMAAEGIDISPERLLRVEADMQARGLPYELTPIQLRKHEDALRAIRNNDNFAPEDRNWMVKDYLKEKMGVKPDSPMAKRILDGLDPAGQDIVPLSQDLNRYGVPDELLSEAENAVLAEGYNVRTGGALNERADALDEVRSAARQALRNMPGVTVGQPSELNPSGVGPVAIPLMEGDEVVARVIVNPDRRSVIDIRDASDNMRQNLAALLYDQGVPISADVGAMRRPAAAAEPPRRRAPESMGDMEVWERERVERGLTMAPDEIRQIRENHARTLLTANDGNLQDAFNDLVNRTGATPAGARAATRAASRELGYGDPGNNWRPIMTDVAQTLAQRIQGQEPEDVFFYLRGQGVPRAAAEEASGFRAIRTEADRRRVRAAGMSEESAATRVGREIRDVHTPEVGEPQGDLFRGAEGTEGVPRRAPSVVQAMQGDVRGQGAEAFKRTAAAGDSWTITNLDRQVAERHNRTMREWRNGGAPDDQRFSLGSTTGPEGEDPAQRWIVSPEKRWETRLPAPTGEGYLTPEAVAIFRNTFADDLELSNRYIGTWWNPEDGRVYLDISEGHDVEEVARRLAQDGRQAGIFDFQNKEFVETPALETVRAQAENRAWLDERVPWRAARRDAAFLDSLSEADLAFYNSRPASEQAQMRRIFSLMPTAEEGATYSAVGAHQLGWYNDSGAALHEVYGLDAPRMAALLAATSPNTGIERNTAAALEIWNEWVRAGRSSDPEVLKPIFDEAATRNGLVPTAWNNTLRVLAEQDNAIFLDPDILKEGGLLSGLKVDPFYANQMGETQRVVIDTHQLKEGPARALTKGRRAGMSASVRAGGKEAETHFGRPLQPRESQETRWSVLKAMSEAAPGGSVEEYLFPEGEFSPERFAEVQRRVRETPSFATLLNSEENAGRLRAGNLQPPTPRESQYPEGIPGFEMTPERQQHMRSLAQRMDMSRNEDFLFQMAPWLGAGMAGEIARRQGLFGPAQEEAQPQAPQAPRPRLF